VGFPVGVAIAIARKHVARAEEADREREAFRSRPDPYADHVETDPVILRILADAERRHEAERIARAERADRRLRIFCSILLGFIALFTIWMFAQIP
jgi:hypothetical protein